MDTKDNLKEDVIRIRLMVGSRETSVTCKVKDEESLRYAAKQFSDMYSYYSKLYGNIDERDLLCVTGLHFAYQLQTQSDNDKTVSI
jgi:cell division protein ZapA (FtsZ GTPase activity inhibitor)